MISNTVRSSHIHVGAPRRPRIVARAQRALRDLPEPVREYAPLAGFVAVTAAAALYGSRFNPSAENRKTQIWYATRHKSPLNPPAAVFGPVWGTLYPMIALAGWRVYRAPRSRARSRALAWWSAQMALNAVWSRLFFGARMPTAALADLSAMTGAIGGFAISARKVDRSASRLMLPYLAWATFAGYLNAEIVRRNR